MASKVSLPGLQGDQDRHGNWRWYFVKKRRKARLEGVSGPPPLSLTKEVRAAYDAAVAKLEGSSKELASPGTMAWLSQAWQHSDDFKALGDLTRRNYAGALKRLMAEKGEHCPFGEVPFLAVRRPNIMRLVGRVKGDEAANYRLKTIRRLFKWALSEELVTTNPAREAEGRKVASLGHVAWTMEHVEQFEKRHPPGTTAWLALQLHLYTAARRSDVVAFGPVNIRGDRVRWIQTKNKDRAPVAMDIPLLPPLARALRVSEPILGDTAFLQTAWSRPFSAAGYGGRFRKWVDEAELPGELTSHGVRKLVGINAAMNGATAKQIQEVLGHASIEQGETYVRQASRIKLADEGFARAWKAPTE